MIQEKRADKLSKERRELLKLLLQDKGSGSSADSSPIVRANAGQTAVVLSFPQQRLWFLNRLMPESSAFNIFKAVRLRGRLQVDVLEATLTEIHRRHESLRTTFELVDDRPLQIIHPPQPLRLTVEHLKAMDPSEKEAELNRLADAERVATFDLSLGPLLRCKLLHLDVEDHVILLNMHHIISDGWSIALLLKEIMLLYEAFRQNAPSPLPELPIQYPDFALWQRRQVEQHSWKRQLAYWKQKLSPAPAALEIIPDRKRSAGNLFLGAIESIVFLPGLREELIAFSRQREVTLFMLLLAGFYALLFRYTGQEDFTIGTPIANRRRKETEDLIGAFINTQVMRANCSGAPTVFELLERTRQTCLEAYTNQDVPFEKVVEEVNPQRTLNEQPLFQIMFTLRNEPVEKVTCPGIDVTYLSGDKRTVMFPLALSIHDVDNVLSCWMDYSSELFETSTVRRMLVHYRNLLMAMVANPEKRISEIEYLSEKERRQILTEWSGAAEFFPHEHTVHRSFEAQVEKMPQAIALEFEAKHLTFAELNTRANQLAHYLLEKGLQAESVVAVILKRSFSLPLSLLAILKAGCAYLPLDPDSPGDRLTHILNESGASAIITEGSASPAIGTAVKTVIFLDQVDEDVAQRPGHNVETTCQMDRLAYVMYTSGSTGVPRGVAVTHRNIVRLVCNQSYFHADHTDVFLQVSPVWFDASTFEIWGSLLNGSLLVIYSPRKPLWDELAPAIEEKQVTVLFLTTPLFEQMVDAHSESLSGVRQLLTGGDVLPEAQARHVVCNLKRVSLTNAYGPTENATMTTTYHVPESHDFSKPLPIGFPIRNSTVYVLDRDLTPVGMGVAGELYTGGDGIARGYLHQPALTAEKFLPDLFSGRAGARLYRTGDRARWLPEGALEFLGRMDEQLKVRGIRIEPAEIEAAMNQHEQVETSVVVPSEDSMGQTRLIAYYIAKAPALSEGDLRLYLRQKLPEYMVPARFMRLEQLPLSSSGKINRKALPKVEPAMFAADGASADFSQTEGILRSIWNEVLGQDVMDVQANFFELGGHSLLATQVLARISAHFRIDLPLRAIFECPTIRTLAATIDQRQGFSMEPISWHATPLVRVENGELDGLLEEVARLSEEQAQGLLADESE